MKTGKRGLIGESIALTVTTAVVLILLVLFFIFLKFIPYNAATASPAEIKNSQLISLKNILNADFGGETTADMIREWQISKNAGKLKSSLGGILNKMEYTRNNRTRGYAILISEQALPENAVNGDLIISSKGYDKSECISSDEGCITQTIALPTENGLIYAGLSESEAENE